jgi:hypothetical protein
MTLVVAAVSRQSIWLMTDRRISYRDGPPRDNAIKMLALETIDGMALLGYCGLGETVGGTEPGEWMARVLRGRRGVSLEHALGILRHAMEEQIPPHLHDVNPLAEEEQHSVVAAAFLQKRPRLYSIDLVIHRPSRMKRSRFTSWTRRDRHMGEAGPGVGVGGSGVAAARPNGPWVKTLRKVLKAYARARISELGVAQHLAGLNLHVHKELLQSDRSVGAGCIVAWRTSSSGNGHQFFNGTTPINTPTVPSISNGFDAGAIATVFMEHMIKGLEQRSERAQRGERPTPRHEAEMEQRYRDAMRTVESLPDEPDEDLSEITR